MIRIRRISRSDQGVDKIGVLWVMGDDSAFEPACVQHCSAFWWDKSLSVQVQEASQALWFTLYTNVEIKRFLSQYMVPAARAQIYV